MNYAGRLFRPVSNSPNREVNGEKQFRYEQRGNLFSATYSGGGIRAGHMLGSCDAKGNLRFCYHHVLDDVGVLRSGVCESRPEILPDGRIRMHECWRWTLGASGAGEAIVEEIIPASRSSPLPRKVQK